MANNYTYSSSHPGSGDSSPRSREIDCETAVAVAAWDEAPPQPPAAVAAAASARVKLMCSYGGRIMPRSHDNQLSYAGGDTKILAVDRSIRYSSIIAKLTALSSSASSDDVILKYQLPGEDLDALISVTNDEDLEHMMIEYDRLHRTGSKSVPRLRLFLFYVMGKGSQDRASFADPPAAPAVTTPKEGPDYLFGLEGAATITTNLLPEAEVKDPAVEKAGIEVASPPARSVEAEAEAVVPTQAELQMHVQELQRLQIAEKQQQQQRNGSDETLARVYPAEYFAPPSPVQDKAPPAPAMAPVTAPPPAYWQDPHRSVAPAPGPRFASFMGGDGNLYLIPANPGLYPASAAPGQTYYTTVQRMVPATAFDNSPSVYGAAPPQQAKVPAAAYDNGGVRAQQQAVEVSAAGYGGVAPPPAVSAGAYDNVAGYAAYDNVGRPVYYAGPGATYQTANNAAIAAESNVLKPSQSQVS